MRVMVTGGAGYIGSHMVRRLLDRGHTVVVLDDLSHGFRAAIDPRSAFVRASILDRAATVQALKAHAVEAVLHFAAYIEVGESVADPEKYYGNNAQGGLTLLGAAREAGVGRIVFSSTAAVYGNPVATPIVEEHPLLPINPYGRTKLLIENALADYAVAYRLGSVALRYFNVAGATPDGRLGEAHEPESHLIPRVLGVALGGAERVKIYGTDYPTRDGTCIRDYVHVEDLVSAHLLALEHVQPGQAKAYNLGSETGFTVREVVETCRRVTGHALPADELPRRPGDPAVLVAGSARIRQELGWKLAYPELETMVRHAWQWHKTHPHGYGHA
jgi:UDP-glucose 4-epimerase